MKFHKVDRLRFLIFSLVMTGISLVRHRGLLSGDMLTVFLDGQSGHFSRWK
jgi:hypothetical protein